MRRSIVLVAIPALALTALATAAASCSTPADAPSGPPAADKREACADRHPLRRAYFGDLHVHTSYSFDAWTYGVRSTPADAYAFAKGASVHLPTPKDSPRVTVALDRPLDFAAVTDHAEYLGETSLCSTPGTEAYDSSTCVEYRGGNYLPLGVANISKARSDVCGEGGRGCTAAASPVWKSVRDAAEAAYDRSSACAFTSFVAYEYTYSPLGSNLHRNVIFRGTQVPSAPITYYDAPTPLDLWTQLATTCRNAGNGCDVLAIPHNSNLSNGRMFQVESGSDESLEGQRKVASLRASMEPLVEISQHKGQSECIRGLSDVAGASDELCEFEPAQRQPLQDCGEGTGVGGLGGIGCVAARDYVRAALTLGLAAEKRLGVNPLKLGMIGSTDTHDGTPGNVGETQFKGHTGDLDSTPEGALNVETTLGDRAFSNPGGLAGVWAEENSREAIFGALRKKEAFGTSGPRILVRFFGGWAYDDALCADPALVEKAYAGGVPMGSDLPKRPSDARAPAFLVSASADVGSATAPGTPLERIQIVKGWLAADGTLAQKVFDVAGDTKHTASVDPTTCTRTGAGATSLCAVFRDPEFDPALRAFYYARVLENPSCRWSTYMCNALTPERRAALRCDNLGPPKTIQERAWTSPIWTSPD